jgi:gamma-glutamyltranspeptidase/glutathione hydrolase
MDLIGWNTVTVPGMVSGWIELSRKFGKLPFAQLFRRAIEYAENGFPVSPVIARQWREAAPILKNEPGFSDGFTNIAASATGGTREFIADSDDRLGVLSRYPVN